MSAPLTEGYRPCAPLYTLSPSPRPNPTCSRCSHAGTRRLGSSPKGEPFGRPHRAAPTRDTSVQYSAALIRAAGSACSGLMWTPPLRGSAVHLECSDKLRAGSKRRYIFCLHTAHKAIERHARALLLVSFLARARKVHRSSCGKSNLIFGRLPRAQAPSQ